MTHRPVNYRLLLPGITKSTLPLRALNVCRPPMSPQLSNVLTVLMYSVSRDKTPAAFPSPKNKTYRCQFKMAMEAGLLEKKKNKLLNNAKMFGQRGKKIVI